MGLFSLVTLLALDHPYPLTIRRAAWYHKEALTFSDALDDMRIRLRRESHFPMSGMKTETMQISKPLPDRLKNAFAYAT
jgi:hypothetical protein